MQGLIGAGDHFHLEYRYIATVNNQNCPEIPFAFLLPLQASMSPCASRYHSNSMQCSVCIGSVLCLILSSFHLRDTIWLDRCHPTPSRPSSSFCPPAAKETMDDKT